MLFFDEKSVLQMLEKYSEQPAFRNFFKRKIQEILKESGSSPKVTSSASAKTGKIDRNYVKSIVEEVIKEQGLKTSAEAATNTVQKRSLLTVIIGIVSLVRKQNIFLVSFIAFVVFLILGYIFKSVILWIIALIFVLVIIWISYSWKVTHRQIFGKKKRSL